MIEVKAHRPIFNLISFLLLNKLFISELTLVC